MRSRDVWVDVAKQAGVAIEHAGLCVAARRPEALRVLEAFLATDMGADCRLLTAAQAARTVPALRQSSLSGVLWCVRRQCEAAAVPKLARWLEAGLGVGCARVRQAGGAARRDDAGTVLARWRSSAEPRVESCSPTASAPTGSQPASCTCARCASRTRVSPRRCRDVGPRPRALSRLRRTPEAAALRHGAAGRGRTRQRRAPDC